MLSAFNRYILVIRSLCVSGPIGCVVLQKTSGGLRGDKSPVWSPWQPSPGPQWCPSQQQPAESIFHPSVQLAHFQVGSWRLRDLYLRLHPQRLLLRLWPRHPGGAFTQSNSEVMRKTCWHWLFQILKPQNDDCVILLISEIDFLLWCEHVSMPKVNCVWKIHVSATTLCRHPIITWDMCNMTVLSLKHPPTICSLWWVKVR